MNRAEQAEILLLNWKYSDRIIVVSDIFENNMIP